MAFDHERLDVYQVALEFLTLAEKVIAGLPRGRSHLADQLERASLSIVLNIAEGAGKVSGPDKRRSYLSARGSATESAARLDVYLRLQLAASDDHRTGKEMLERIVAMLVRLAKSFEPSGSGSGSGSGIEIRPMRSRSDGGKAGMGGRAQSEHPKSRVVLADLGGRQHFAPR